MSRPGSSPAAGLALALCALAGPAAAELVVMVDGSFLKVVSYRAEGGRAKMELDSGGRLVLPLSRIERVVDDEIVPPEAVEPLPPVAAQTLSIGFDHAEPVPDTRFGELIWETAKRHGLSPRLVAAVVRAESAFDPRAVSIKGARGLMQLMPATAERFGVPAARLFEPGENLEAGARYLRWLAERYGGDLTRMLAAYNAGEANVDRYDGVPPFRETRDFVRRIYGWLGLAATL